MKKITKKIVSLTLVVMMIVSTMAVSMVSTSAATSTKCKYVINIQSGAKDGLSGDIIQLKLDGTKGSTDWFNAPAVALGRNGQQQITHKDIGEIKSISAKNIGVNGWYPEVFKIKKMVGGSTVETTTIYGGKWVDDNKETTFNKNANVYEVFIKTSNKFGAGTNSDVCVTLHGENKVKSERINASSLSSATDAFERGDETTLYIAVPDNFGKLTKAEFGLQVDGMYLVAGCALLFGIADIFNSDWRLESTTIKKVSGDSDVNCTYSSGVINKVVNEPYIVELK